MSDPAHLNLSEPCRTMFTIQRGPRIADHIRDEDGRETGLVILRDMDTRKPIGFELYGYELTHKEPTDGE